MKKTWHRLLLDLILLVGLATFYSDKIISMAYHEIGALVLFGLFILHLIFNYKWIKSVFVKIFSRKIPLRTRLLCILDVLLLLSWAMVIVSGACISKVVFSFRVMGQWKMLHFFFAALSLILTGIHLGFHVKYLGINLKKILPISLPALVKKILVVALSVVIIVFGAMNYSDFGLSRWLSMPFAASAMGGPSGEMGGPSGEMGGPASGEAGREMGQAEPAADSSAEITEAPAEEAVSEKEPSPVIPVYGITADAAVSEAEDNLTEASGEAEESDTASGEFTHSRASGEMGGPSGEMGGGARIGRVLMLVWQIGSVVLAVMTVTGWVDSLCLWAKGRIRAGKKAKSREE